MPNPSNPRKRPNPTTPKAKRRPQLSGEVTYIDVPHPPRSAMNKKRSVSSLIQAQLQHICHAERARLPKEKRDGRSPGDFLTEGEAANYIAAVTRILHPRGRKKPRAKSNR